MAADSGLCVEDFLLTDRVCAARTIRVLGRADNAAAVEWLHNYMARHKLPATTRILLGDPSTVVRNDAGPGEILTATWHAITSRDAVCRWHPLTDSDYTAYALVSAVRCAGGRVTDKARRLLLYHPAYPAISFIPGTNVDACCQLLSEIVDIRWFRHPDRPNRITRLNSYLGLTPRNAVAMLVEPPRPVTPRYSRAVLAATAWLGYPPGMLGTSTPPVLSPRDCLRRIYATAPSRVKGLLLATQKFVRFIREVWGGERDPNTLCFDPEQFFNSHEEIYAYQEHRRALNPVAD